MKLTKKEVEGIQEHVLRTGDTERQRLCDDWLAMREMLEMLEWRGPGDAYNDVCPCCYYDRTDGHQPDCKLKKILR